MSVPSRYGRATRRSHYLAPARGTDTESCLDAAIDALGDLRGLSRPRDASAELHLLASLVAEAASRLPQAVAAARDEQCSWAQIGDLLGVGRAAAHQRYGAAQRRLGSPQDQRPTGAGSLSPYHPKSR